MPEELVKPEELSKYRQVASHVVSGGVLQTWRPGPPRLFLGWGRSAWSVARASGPAPFLVLAAELSGFSSCPALAFPIAYEGLTASRQKSKCSG